jgi:hypothetical protein
MESECCETVYALLGIDRGFSVHTTATICSTENRLLFMANLLIRYGEIRRKTNSKPGLLLPCHLTW